MNKPVTTISMDKRVRELADELMDLRKFSSFTGLLEQLIREEHERRNGSAVFRENSPHHRVSNLASKK